MPTCNSCGAAVIWVVTLAGKPMPVNAKPVDDGNLVLEEVDGGPETRHRTILQARAVEPLLDTEKSKYVSHFATCPNAKEHRKR